MPIPYPGALAAGNNSFGTFNALTMDAATEKVAFTIPAPRDGTINRVGFRFNLVPNPPANGLTVSFQGGDGTGLPDGIPTHTRLIPVGDIVVNAWVETGLITDDGTDTGAKKTVLQGEQLYTVIEFASFVAGDDIRIAHNIIAFYGLTRSNTYAMLFTAAWVKQSPTALCFAIEYEDIGWVPVFGCIPAETAASTSMTSASNPNERGMKFTLPVALRANGFLVHKSATATTGTFQMVLYDENDTVLATATPDPDVFSTVGNAGLSWYPFENVPNVELESETTYRVALKATGAGGVALNGIQPNSIVNSSAMPWGERGVQTVRGGGAWTDDSTTGIQYFIGLTIDAIDPVKGDGRGRGILRNICNFMRSFLR